MITDLQTKIKQAQASGYNAAQIGTYLKSKGVAQSEIDTALAPDTALSRVTDTIKQKGATVESAIAGDETFAGQSAVRRGVEATAEAASAVPAVVKAVLPEPVRNGVDAAGGALGKGMKAITDAIASIPGLAQLITSHPKVAKAIEEVAGTASAGGEIAGDLLGAEGGAATAAKTSTALSKVPGAVSRGTEGLLTRSKELANPSPTAAEAVGEILQGKTKDVKPGIQALGSKGPDGKPVVKTEGVKTFSELNGKIDDAIKELSGQVDAHLGQDTTPTLLDDLTTHTTTKAGTAVSRNYVETALDHLKELYTTTADDIGAAEVGELINKAKTTGLTKTEVNDISRLYGHEFGQKAFSKTGDPLTSVNAQMYENVRSGLKEKAREGIGGGAAEATDKVISSLYNTKRLVAKNVEAVQKLQQRIADRGPLEKVGHAVAKYADILSGGSIRGLIGGLLPRGAGYKVMNALDLEERLERNLKVINDAVRNGSDDAILKAVKSLDGTSQGL